MKKHNILKVILLSILVVVICTWIFPSATYSQYGFQVGDRAQVGLFDVFSDFTNGVLYNFPYVIMIVLATGIFYGVSYKIPAYRILLDKIVEKFKKRESIFLALSMILIAAIVSVSGLSLGMIFIFPLIISLILLMGYNKLVAASVTVGSTMVGLMGTTLGVFATEYINYALNIDYSSEILTKIIILVIGLVLLVYNVILYANKTKNGTDKVLELVPDEVKDAKKSKPEMVETQKKEEVKEISKPASSSSSKKTTSKNASKGTTKTTKSKKTETKKTTKKTKAYDLKSKTETKVVVKKEKKVHIWPYVLFFDLTFIVLIVSVISWQDTFGINWFTNALNAIQEFTIFDFPIFAKILGNVQAFGSWSLYSEIPTFIILMSCLLAFIYGIKFNDFLDGVVSGIKKALRPAIYMILIYLVLFIAATNLFQLNIMKFFLDLTKGFNVITMTVVAMISSIFNLETGYMAQFALPYVTSVITDTTLYPLLGVLFQSVYGLIMLVAPTSVILLGTLTYLDISYGQWLKHIWKLFLQLLLLIVIIFFILFLI